MTKITVEQAVAAVQSAKTASEIQAVLEHCKKDQLHEVFLAVTGAQSELCTKSWKKADLVRQYTARTIAFKAREEFKVMDAKARAEYLTSQKYEQENNCVDTLVRLLSLYDLITLNMALGVSFEEYKADANTRYGRTNSLKFVLSTFISHVVFMASLAARMQRHIEEEVAYIEETLKMNDPQYLKWRLREASREAMKMLVKRIGLWCDVSDDGSMCQAILQYHSDCVKARTEDNAPEFNEECYIPDYQENRAALDDIPESHTPDIQEVSATSYEDVRRAYNDYYNAQGRYLDSNETDKIEQKIADEAYRKYLMLLGTYRRGSKPKREEALNWIRDRCGEAALPVERLRSYSFDYLVELSHKCGIHAANFKKSCSKHDMAIRLIREAGIETSEKTFYEEAVIRRKRLQAGIHKLWQKRHAIRKAQRMLGEGSADSEALNDVWELYCAEADDWMYEYRQVCETLKNGRVYEAERRNVA